MYTLIAFAIIGLVLAFVRPKIEELQDRAIIEQSILMLKDIDSSLLTMGGAGNQRVIEISIKKGDLKIDGETDKIIFEMESRLSYSEPLKIINDGNIKILTEKSGNLNKITLTRNFENDYNITNMKRDDVRTISKAPVAYTLKISNRGTETFLDIYHGCIPPAITNCLPPNHYSSECVQAPLPSTSYYCEYTSERPTFDFELL